MFTILTDQKDKQLVNLKALSSKNAGVMRNREIEDAVWAWRRFSHLGLIILFRLSISRREGEIEERARERGGGRALTEINGQ